MKADVSHHPGGYLTMKQFVKNFLFCAVACLAGIGVFTLSCSVPGRILAFGWSVLDASASISHKLYSSTH